jgi:hypothetical protein
MSFETPHTNPERNDPAIDSERLVNIAGHMAQIGGVLTSGRDLEKTFDFPAKKVSFEGVGILLWQQVGNLVHVRATKKRHDDSTLDLEVDCNFKIAEDGSCTLVRADDAYKIASPNERAGAFDFYYVNTAPDGAMATGHEPDGSLMDSERLAECEQFIAGFHGAFQEWHTD